jgi:hypothetical protein
MELLVHLVSLSMLATERAAGKILHSNCCPFTCSYSELCDHAITNLAATAAARSMAGKTFDASCSRAASGSNMANIAGKGSCGVQNSQFY